MLNAFSARSILELPAKDRLRVESVLAYGDKLLLGLSTGTLRIYRVRSPDSPDISLELERSIDRFSRNKIEVLASIKEAGILVSLSDNYVHIHELLDFSLTETPTKTKGASTLAVTSYTAWDDSGIPSIVSRLAVGVRQKLLLYTWQDGGFEEGKEVLLNGRVRSLTWTAGGKVVAGLPSGFVAIDAVAGSVEEIELAPPDTNGSTGADDRGWGSYMGWQSSKALSTGLGDEMLLVKDSMTLFIDPQCKPLPERKPIPWTSPPDAVAYSYPYLVSLNATKQHLEIRNPRTITLLQTIVLPHVSTLHVPPPNVALAHAGKLFFVTSGTQVWRMSAMDYQAQVQELVDGDQLDEAISLLEMLEDPLLEDRKDEKLREVKMLKAQRLFEKRRYEKSMDLFREVSAPPERVIRLFPRSIAGDLSIWPDSETGDVNSDAGEDQVEDGGDVPSPVDSEKEKENVKIQEQSDITAAPDDETEAQAKRVESPSAKAEDDIAQLTPERRTDTPSIGTPEPRPIPQAPSPERLNGVGSPESSSLRGLTWKRKKPGYSDAASIFSFGSRPKEEDSATKLLQKASEPIELAPLEGDELKKATNELKRSFLTEYRRLLQRFFEDGRPLDPLKVDIPATGDTVEDAQRSGLKSYLTTIDGMLRTSDPEAVQARLEKLMDTSRLIETTLFRSYLLTSPSLVGSLVRLPNHCDPDVVSEQLRAKGKFNDLVDFLERKELHREALELLHFFGKQEEEDSRAPTLLGPRRTVEYLKRRNAAQIDLILEFAEWPLRTAPELGMQIFIDDTGNSDTLPRQQVLSYLERISQTLAVEYLEHIVTNLHDDTPEFHTLLARLYFNVLSSEVLSSDDRPSWQARFLDFLTRSDQYRAEKVLSYLPRDDPDFYEARAVVLSKMGRHQAALEIYVFKLSDHEKAEAYCAAVHLAAPTSTTTQTDEATPATVYHTLLSLYLCPPAPYSQQLGPALQILSRHGARLQASEALKLIPEDIAVADLESYFEQRIRHANSRVGESKMKAALLGSWRVDVQERLMLGQRSKHVIVKEGSVCPECHKRLGLSILTRLSGGQVVHYGCAQKAQKR